MDGMSNVQTSEPLRPAPRVVSLVIPLYNEEPVFPLLRARLDEFRETLTGESEIILVNDGSSDQTLRMAREWAAERQGIVVLALSRNFGHQAAATAGLDAAKGDAIVLMDADLQDPPELVHEMLAQYRKGFDVVYAQRVERRGESLFKRASAWLFYRLMRYMIDSRLPPDTGDYRLVSRQCLDVLISMREQHRFLRGMVTWIGFPQIAVPFVRQPRAAGETKYPLGKMIRFAWTAATSFSPTPLRIVFVMGFLAAIIGIAAGGYSLFAVLWGLPVVPGWTSLMITQSIIGSFILLGIGVAGEYIAKIYEESKGRPIYIVDRFRSLDNREPGDRQNG